MQGFGEKVRFRQLAVDEDQAWRRDFLVELGEEAGHDLVLLQPLGMAGEEGAVAPVRTAADEEGLDTDLPALVCHGEDVRIADAFGIHGLAALNEGRRAQAVAQHGRALVVERFGGLGHMRLDLLLHRARFAAEEVLRLPDKLGVVRLADTVDARGRAALDLIEQTRAIAPRHVAIVAAAQQEQLLQRVDRGVDRAGAGEGAVVIALGPARAAVLLDARESVIGAQQDERERFVVAQQHVVGRAIALDQLRFEEERLGFRIGRHDGHRTRLADHALEALGKAIHLRVVRDAVLQRARLADIEHIAARIVHAVDARLRLQRGDDFADRGHSALDIGLV